MAIKTYIVTRLHQGERDYRPGDEREADENTVSHLVRLGVLIEKKAAHVAENKAVTPPKSKAS